VRTFKLVAIPDKPKTIRREHAPAIKYAKARARFYKITLVELVRLKKRAQGKCEICKQTRRLVIDHNHTTKKVRGMLCHKCNTMLEYIVDPDWLINATNYLVRSGEIVRANQRTS